MGGALSMDRYGGYTPERELSRGGLSRRFAALGPSGERVLLRVLDAPEGVLGAMEAGAAREIFRRSVTLQRSLASAPQLGAKGGAAGGLAPIVAAGDDDAGAPYCVVAGAAASVAELIDGRILLAPKAIKLIAVSVTAAACSMKLACGRHHGAIAARRILLEVPEQPSAGAICLDAPTVEDDGSEADEVRSIARVLFELAWGKPFGPRSWPVEPNSTARGLLGSACSAWAAALTTALAPEDGQVPTLEAWQATLEGLPLPAPSRKRALLLGGLAAVVLGGASATLFVPRDERSAGAVLAEVEAEHWRRLCYAWDDWAARLVAAAAQNDPEVDRYFRERVLQPLADAIASGVRLDPGEIVGRRGSRRAMADTLPPEAVAPEAVAETARALEIIEQARASMQPDQWRTAALGAELASELERDGATAAASEARSWVASLAAGEAIDADSALTLAASSAVIEDLAAARRALESSLPTVSAVDDRVLRSFAEVARRDASSPEAAIEGIARVTRSWAGVMDRIVSVLGSRWAEIDQRAFREHASAYQRSEEQAASIGAAEAWLREVGEDRFTRLDPESEPHPAEALRTALSAAEARFSALAESERSRPAGIAAAERLADARAVIEELAALPWNRVVRSSVEGRAAQERAAIAAVLGEVDELEWASSMDAGEYAARLRAEQTLTASASEAVDSAWRRARDQRLAEGLDGRLVETRRWVRGWRAAALEAIQRFPLLEISGADGALDDEALSAIALRQRETSLARAFAGRGPDDPVFADRLSEVAEQDARWREQAAEIVGRAVRGLRAVRELRGLSAASAAAGGGSAELGSDAEAIALTEAIRPALDAMIALETVEQETDPAALLRASSSAESPVALAAYQRLGSMGWPGGAEELARDADALARVRGLTETLEDPVQRGALERELQSDARRRWVGAVEAASTRGELASIWGFRDRYGAGLDALAPRDAHDMAAAVLLASIDERATEEALRDAAAAFVAAIADAAESESWAADRMAAVRRVLDERSDGPGVDPTRLGPGALPGWRGVSVPGNQVVSFTSRDGQTIEFAAVTLADGSVSYLGTTEVSLGLFSAVVSLADAWDQVASSDRWNALAGMRRAIVQNPWRGVRGWQWSRNSRSLEPSLNWHGLFPMLQDVNMVAQSLGTDGLGGVPSERHPMHGVPGASAEAFAGLLGCTLPTTEEWLAAWSAERGETDWNLRDESFAIQYAHQASQVADYREASLPDEGVLRPGDGPAAVPGDDGTAFFGVVGGGDAPGERFKHLIGNVLEFVENDGSLARIGESSLSVASNSSPPSPEPIDPTRIVQDSGIRLAFKAPGVRVEVPLADALKAVFGQQPFMSASRR